MDTGQRTAEILLEINAIHFNKKNPFTWSSGLIAPMYCDNRIIMGFVDKRREITQLFADMVEEKIGSDCIDRVCGVSTAGIPHAAWLAEKLNKPLAYARKKPKQYGKERIVEGVLKSGDRVLMVEDIVSTGRSSLLCVEEIRRQRGKCDNCIAIVNYQLGFQEKNFAKKKCRLFSLTNFSEIIDAVIERQYFSAEQVEEIFRWKRNPISWSIEKCLA